MPTPISRNLDHLKSRILAMGGLVEDTLSQACAAVVQRRVEFVDKVRDAERQIDKQELEIDDECVKILALLQPVAGDLRFVTAVMKINNDLERIGDLSRNIAARAAYLIDRPPLAEGVQVDQMARIASEMLHSALDALVRGDSQLARAVCARDNEIDDLHKRHFKVLQDLMKGDPDTVEAAVALLSVSRNFERIGDHATNIAEDVVYSVEAQDIRHPGAQWHDK